MARRIVVWLRNDLRLTDSSPFSKAVSLAKSSSAEVLPVYCFDPRQYGATDQVFLGKGFGAPKTAHHRAKFILASVLDLKNRLRAIGSDLLILVGKPEQMLPTVLGGAAQLTAGQAPSLVLASAEVCYEERAVERAVSRAIRTCGGAQLELLWGHSLYEMDDVLEQFGPGLERMPDGFTPFKNTVERHCALREPLPHPTKGQLPLPADTCVHHQLAADNGQSSSSCCFVVASL
jgi:deoxyribodipyrimidine photo-lyase